VWESPSSPNTAGWVADAASGDWHVAFGGGSFGAEVWPDPDLRFGSAVLSRWPIDDQALHLLPAADDDPAVTSVPWELLWASTAGLDVFSTHLAPAPSWTQHRCVQVLAIDEHLRAIRGDKDALPAGKVRPAMPAVLCGDFNAEPESDEIRYLTGFTQLEGRTAFFQDAWRVAGDGTPGLTQDWQHNPIAASMNVHRKRIDYVLVGDPFLRAGRAGRVLSAEVCCREALTGVLASDHFGLVVDISWPDRP
jgi:endonuclease/exonuclease/phosphatase family metal-dependent hydrolase